MSEAETPTSYPSSLFKGPKLGNLTNSDAYPAWKPVDTRTDTARLFRLTFYSTVGAYAWLYFWKRTTFKLEIPMAAVGFVTVATATKGTVTNLREKNDAWNTFWGVGAGNLAVLSVGMKQMPVKHKVLTGFGGAIVTAVIDHCFWAQSPSYAGKDAKYMGANTDQEVPKQQFWDIWKRRPLSQTVQELGEGRGIFKP